jgi:hypothetical protein
MDSRIPFEAMHLYALTELHDQEAIELDHAHMSLNWPQ